MAAKTPPEIDRTILDFCDGIRRGIEPVYVPIKTGDATGYLDCYHNVQAKTKTNQGQIEYGWAIYVDPGWLIEAMHHAVWVSPDGERICVSPHVNESRLLFLPDPERPYQGKPIGNFRRGLRDDPRMTEYIRLNDEADKL